MFQALPGFPSNVDQSRASSIQDRLRELSRFQAAARAVRAAPKSECKARALALRDQYPDALPPALRELPLTEVHLNAFHPHVTEVASGLERLLNHFGPP